MDDILESTQILTNNVRSKDEELCELSLAGGITVWGANQEVLEQQALTELDIFTKENEKVNPHVEDEFEEGEIIETPESKKALDVTLNFENYIKRQEDLKKRQDLKKSLASHYPTVGVTNKVLNKSKKKKKRKVVAQGEITASEKLVEVNEATKSTIVSSSKSTVATYESLEFKEVADAGEEANADEDSGSEYAPSEGDIDDSDYEGEFKIDLGSEKVSSSQKRKRFQVNNTQKIRDDGVWEYYKTRLKVHYKKLEENVSLKEISNDDDNDVEEEKVEYQILKGGLKVPINIWNRLYGYQQEAVKWLWKLHQKETGGILGDEMGLGKTVQIIAFLQSLEISRVISCHGRFNGLGPSLIVCPATVVHQWVKHFHEWAPEFRIGVLHQSGNFQGNKADLIKEMHKSKGIIVTTYLGILKYKGNLLDYNWHYLILDEGHKIRNPTAKVTIAIKHIRTPHRIMLTGSPMQNNLTELWSLFDFTNPGMLGNLTTFQEHFATPILHGGFANSTSMQEATALSVATTLKEIIVPYLLRRTKAEVQHHISLPNKSEQVLFCSLTKEQKDMYKDYLMSEQVNMILGRGIKNWFSQNFIRANVLVAITALRKICNHPDIYLHGSNTGELKNNLADKEDGFGYYKKSGKMVVVSALLKIWKQQGHRVLLFSQGRSMITIFQMFLEQQGYKYLKMDGSTSISSRQPLIDKFNNDVNYDVFLLTTRVGGLGINLTGANRVIIYDPDWNPATDTQARERAWRIGQDKQVTIYRLLSAGTIEEKMYQRQVWKQLLSNKVLLDPRTSRFFKSSDLYDLFSLQENDANPETANIFYDSRVRIQENIKKSKKEKKKQKVTAESSEDSTDITFSEDKIKAMKNLAQQIAKSLSQKESKKSSLQKELEEERQLKLKQKAELKQLTPEALFLYNKEKANAQEDTSVNKIDGSQAKVGFSEALKYAEKTAKLHHILNSKKGEIQGKIVRTAEKIQKTVIKENSENILDKYKQPSTSSNKIEPKEKKGKDPYKTKIDNSGIVDGEHVDGLVRSEMRKYKKNKTKSNNNNQDDFVLERLFQKKGVSGALQHDSVVESKSQGNSLRIHTEARFRAEKSLEALRKSRIDNWRW